MAITNAQQYQQLVNPPMDGKRPGYRGDDAYGGGDSVAGGGDQGFGGDESSQVQNDRSKRRNKQLIKEQRVNRDR